VWSASARNPIGDLRARADRLAGGDDHRHAQLAARAGREVAVVGEDLEDERQLQ
jgi:hypothetical protein